MADAMTDALHCAKAFLRPAHLSAVKSLGLRNGTSGLDLGCGVGSIWPIISNMVGAETRLTAIDISEHCIAEARKQIDACGFRQPVELQHRDIEGFLDTKPAPFDWIWTADVLSPHMFEDVSAIVRHCAEAILPGGVFACFTANYYRSVFLPGYARLESLILRASQKRWGLDAASGRQHYESALHWLYDAGFGRPTLTLHPAVYTAADLAERDDVKGYIENVVFADYAQAIARHAEEVGLKRQDVALWERLSSPDSDAYLLHQTGYFCYQIGLLVAGRRD